VGVAVTQLAREATLAERASCVPCKQLPEAEHAAMWAGMQAAVAAARRDGGDLTTLLNPFRTLLNPNGPHLNLTILKIPLLIVIVLQAETTAP
jgi:hypothetical protein